MDRRLGTAIVALSVVAVALLSILLDALVFQKEQPATEPVLPAATADELSIRLDTALSDCVSETLEHAPFECTLTEATSHTGWFKFVITLETTDAVAEEATPDDLRELWDVLEPCMHGNRVLVSLEMQKPGADAWGTLEGVKRENGWEVDASISEFAINAPSYHFVNNIDRSVDGQQCMIVTLPMVNRISRRLDQLGWTIKHRTERHFNAKPDTPGLSLSVTLTPESASVAQWTPNDVNGFLQISQIVSTELGISTALDEKLNSVIGSPKYYRANNGDFVRWTWILNGLEARYNHSSSLDTLDITYAGP